jgi:hypothetical protein
MSEYEETDSLTRAVAKAIGDTIYGYVDPNDTPNTWKSAIDAAGAALGAFYDFHAKPPEGDVFEETEEDYRKRRGLDDAYDAGRSDGAEEALRAAMMRRDFP